MSRIRGRGAHFLRGLFVCAAAAASGCQPAETDPRVAVSAETVIAAPRTLGVNVGMTTYFNDNHVLADAVVHGDFAKGRRVTLTQVDMTGADRFSAAEPGVAFDERAASFAGGSYWIGTGAAAGRAGAILGHRGAEIEIGADAAALAPGDWVWLRSAPQPAAAPVRRHGETYLGIGDFRIEARAADVRLVDGSAGAAGQAVRSEGAAPGLVVVSHYVRLFAANSYQLRVRARGSEGTSWSARLFRPGRDGAANETLAICAAQTLGESWSGGEHTFQSPPGLREGEGIWRLDVIGAHGEGLPSFIEIDSVAFEGQPASPYGVDQRVVDHLRGARVGVLRFLGSASMGGIVDDITSASPGAASWTYYGAQDDYIPFRAFGVVDQWMRLCDELAAAAWIPVGAANTPDDWYNLISYLAAPAGFDAYADKRVSHGRTEPWTDDVEVYLEPGNEWWNRIAPPFYLNDPQALGAVITQLFQAARSHPHFDAERIRLTAGGWAANPNRWTLPLHAAAAGHDVMAIAPYYPSRLADMADDGETLRAFFSETDAYLAYSGKTTFDGLDGPGRPALAIYEINHHLTDKSVPAEAASRFCTSYGAAVSVADRTLAIMNAFQTDPVAFFQLFQRNYQDRAGLWGLSTRTTDGGIAPRPLWQALAMLNAYAIEGDMVRCQVTGGPTWNQPENGPAPAMKRVPAVHAFAFHVPGERPRTNIVLINRSLDATLTVRVEAPHETDANAELVTLVAADPMANNEQGASVFVTGPEPFAFMGYCDVPPCGLLILRVKSPGL